ncbi:MAG: hypothetical protein NPIRA02_16150 [Nitrospirales bacterium]|nr:MAG: hypothetical protein NPIRA02_16150 [Nitrospirales bacterium]
MGATLASFQQFLDAPLTGVGYNSAVTIRYAELLTHTHFVFILASYGVLGILPYVIFVGILFYSTPRESIVKSIAALSMILGVMVSELYLQWWFAIPLFLMWSQAGCSWDSAYDLMKAHRIGGSLISRSVASVRGAKFEGK